MMVLLLSCRIVIKMFPYMPNNDLFRYLIESKVDSDEIRIRFFVAIRDMRLNIDLSSKIDIAALSHQTLMGSYVSYQRCNRQTKLYEQD